MADERTGVLVKFPKDVLADLDSEAKATGDSRMEVIVRRCRKPPPAALERAPEPKQGRGPTTVAAVKVGRLPPGTQARAKAVLEPAYSLPVGPVASPPGSRLKTTTKGRR